MKLKFRFGALFLSIILIYSCSSSSSSEVLNFLFDGVAESDSLILQSNSKVQMDSTSNNPKIVKPISPEFFFHSPYEEKMCESCHDIKASFKKTMDIPELCYQCHEDFQTSYKNLHYPIEAGECKSCHHHHQAKLGKLLLKPVRELCAECHDLEELLAGDMHSGIGETDCTNCHNPHGSNESSLLR